MTHDWVQRKNAINKLIFTQTSSPHIHIFNTLDTWQSPFLDINARSWLVAIIWSTIERTCVCSVHAHNNTHSVNNNARAGIRKVRSAISTPVLFVHLLIGLYSTKHSHRPWLHVEFCFETLMLSFDFLLISTEYRITRSWEWEWSQFLARVVWSMGAVFIRDRCVLLETLD